MGMLSRQLLRRAAISSLAKGMGPSEALQEELEMLDLSRGEIEDLVQDNLAALERERKELERWLKG